MAAASVPIGRRRVHKVMICVTPAEWVVFQAARRRESERTGKEWPRKGTFAREKMIEALGEVE